MEIQNSQLTELSQKAENNSDVNESALKQSLTAAKIQAWLVSYLAEELEIEPDQIDVKTLFDRYGLDSSAALAMTGDLEDWLGFEIEPTLVYDYPTIETLAQYLSEQYKLEESFHN
ncbi:acyl carrier protein [Scytonema tolypothrichoides VB-61278]|nr:acyl carrier protein [Scytonema tolypothrichoides VB-61278]